MPRPPSLLRFASLLAAGLALAAVWSLLLMTGTPTFDSEGSGCRALTSAAQRHLLAPRIVMGVTFVAWAAVGVRLLGWHRAGRGWALVFALLWALTDLAILKVFNPLAVIAFVAAGLFLSVTVFFSWLTSSGKGAPLAYDTPGTWMGVVFGLLLIAGPFLLTLTEPFDRWHAITSC